MFWLFFVLASVMIAFCQGEEDELVTVVAIYRHGSRTPIKVYPNDPYKNASFWPEGFGQLTNTGKMQHFLLGQWLRNRYKNFLPEQYSEKQIYVRSTDLDRTLMSAEANLAGLYPPKGKQIWKDDLVWQPIPIHTTPEKLDNVLSMKCTCDKYTYLLENLKLSPEFIKIQQMNQELYEYLSNHSGGIIDNLRDMLYLYDTLKIEKLNNLILPDWTKPVFPDKMAPWAAFTFAIDCYTPELARLRVGPLLNDIVSHLLNSTRNKGYKFVVYSGHDITIANVLNGLHLFKYHCPTYAATILFELRRINETYFVNMLYKNSSTPEKLTIKNCSYYCPLDKFIEILRPLLITPNQWQTECDLIATEFASYSIVQYAIFIVGLALLILLSFWIMLWLILRMKASQGHIYAPLPSQENVCT